MCDYSLEMYASRPARESEPYVTTRFPSGSIGLAAPNDCATAICVLYDTKLELDNLPEHVKQAKKISDKVEVIFARLDHGAYHDGVRFPDGTAMSLQQLGTGVKVAVTKLIDAKASETTAKIKTPEMAI